jgi:tetratricopeptide (TPR) repeat protein
MFRAVAAVMLVSLCLCASLAAMPEQDYIKMTQQCIHPPFRMDMPFSEEIAPCEAWVKEVESGGYSDQEKSLAYTNRGRIFGWAYVEQSKADINKAIDLDPQNAHALSIRGDFNFFDKRDAQCVSDYAKVLDIDRKTFGDFRLYARISICYERSGDIEKAVQYSRNYLKIMRNEWHERRLEELEKRLKH